MKNINKGYDYIAPKNSFLTDLPFGEKYERESKSILEGKDVKVEVKADRLCQKTGNIYVETESRGKDSGIITTDADVWAFCLWKENRELQTYVYISVKILKKLMTKYPKKVGGDNYTSKGHIIPKEDLLNQII
jgi:hypothetical protein|tara:strand:+ start:1867 stop:2265 length:399 start_codon:yes stop_codon:yes gene_type:complete